MLLHPTPRARLRAIGMTFAGALALAACATPTPYQPATGTGFYRNGYSDQQVEANRFQISFSGNSLTSRETVERYLLYRAAQLTLERGFDNFILADRDTNLRSRTYSTPGFGGGGFGPGWGAGFGWGGWGPAWRYRSRAFGWRSWDPFWGDPFFDRSVDIRTVDKYEAVAEIVLGRGPKPADNIRAFDARDVLRSLGPTVTAPVERR
ncbi:CC0125/CC1285 family lipoprotein [Sphingomonas sp. Leaf407]|uniref:CC0125/CC1285 family lipoprotein n=1 Tax=unclassified Sphingomonas TaxID=196159 RepID=UPI000B2493C1